MASSVSYYEPRYLFEGQSAVYGGRVPSFSDYEQAARIVKSRSFTDVVVLLEGQWGKNFQEAYAAAGLNALHFPIEDYGVPTDEQLKEWIPQIVKIVQTKGRETLIHCQGGIGRTGTIAACVLAALKKMSGDAAIFEIRERIPGAIETSAQEQCVRRFAKVIKGS